MTAVLQQPSTRPDLEGATRREIADHLSRLLADTYTLYVKTQNFHWNVTGPMFQPLHLMFEQQYTDLALAVDLIAERIRALGFRAPGSYREFARLSVIQEDEETSSAEQMLRILAADQVALMTTARSMLGMVEQSHDVVTADLLTQRLAIHEKNAWMLRSFVAG